MEMLKPLFRLFSAAIPVVYCGGLLYYFINGSGSLETAKELGLGPTLLGLAIVGGLFTFAFIARFAWTIAKARSAANITGGPKTSSHDNDDTGGNADEVIARYMAQRGTQPSIAASTPPATQSGAAQSTQSFGRRVR